MITYIAISIAAFAVVIVLLMYVFKRPPKKFSPLSAWAIGLVVMSMVFENRDIAYSLIAIAAILVVADLIIQLRMKNQMEEIS